MSDDTSGSAVSDPLARVNQSARSAGEVQVYGAMIEALREFLNQVAAAKSDEPAVLSLTTDIQRWSRDLAAVSVPEAQQIFGHLIELPGRGQTMAPKFVAKGGDAQSVHGTVTFGRYYLGGNGAVHGGAIPLFFDELLGRLANAGNRSRSRTAYLHTDYRSITPIDVELSVRGWFVSESGRKRVLRAEVRNGETLCAQAEGLFVALLPGQP